MPTPFIAKEKHSNATQPAFVLRIQIILAVNTVSINSMCYCSNHFLMITVGWECEGKLRSSLMEDHACYLCFVTLRCCGLKKPNVPMSHKKDGAFFTKIHRVLIQYYAISCSFLVCLDNVHTNRVVLHFRLYSLI